MVGGGGGGGTENSALSCVSVSRINEVMSWLLSSAFVNIFGGGNLVCVSQVEGRERERHLYA